MYCYRCRAREVWREPFEYRVWVVLTRDDKSARLDDEHTVESDLEDTYPSYSPANKSSLLRISVSEASLRLFNRLFWPSDLKAPAGGSCEANTRLHRFRNHMLVYMKRENRPGACSSSAVAQFSDDMIDVYSLGKFICVMHGYAGGESMSHIVTRRPSPGDTINISAMRDTTKITDHPTAVKSLSL